MNVLTLAKHFPKQSWWILFFSLAIDIPGNFCANNIESKSYDHFHTDIFYSLLESWNTLDILMKKLFLQIMEPFLAHWLPFQIICGENFLKQKGWILSWTLKFDIVDNFCQSFSYDNQHKQCGHFRIGRSPCKDGVLALLTVGEVSGHPSLL